VIFLSKAIAILRGWERRSEVISHTEERKTPFWGGEGKIIRYNAKSSEAIKVGAEMKRFGVITAEKS